jgi:hypothetical protein
MVVFLTIAADRLLNVTASVTAATMKKIPKLRILESFDASECRKVYKMLGVEAAIAAGGSLEASGDVMSVSHLEASST